MNLLKEYKSKIEGELTNFCNDIISLLEKNLVTTSTNSEGKVFYLKMKGDYYRYISEFATGDLHSKASDNALAAYKSATDIACTELKSIHLIRLELALNFSVFYYEVLKDTSNACILSKKAYEDALADAENIEEDQYGDCASNMQLLRDNYILWSYELSLEN